MIPVKGAFSGVAEQASDGGTTDIELLGNADLLNPLRARSWISCFFPTILAGRP